MTRDEAYEKRRRECIALKRENKKLKERIAEYDKGPYESAIMSDHLKQISKLTWENRHLKNERDRYKGNWQSQVRVTENFSVIAFDAEFERNELKAELALCRKEIEELKSRIQFILGESASHASVKAQVAALTEALLKEKAKANNDSTNSGIDSILGNGIHLSEEFICKLQKRASKGLSFFVEEVRLECIKSSILHWDDTVIFINTKRGCMRFYGNDEQRLITRIDKYKDNHFLWAKDFSVAPTNNLAERSLRSQKIKLKVSGQFQSVETAGFFANIRTYTETCYRNGIGTFEALVRLTSGNPFTLKEVLGEA